MKLRKVGLIVGGVVLFALLALPSVLIYLEKKSDERFESERALIADYLVFSHSIHMRGYWAMSSLDDAMEAGGNSGDYGSTTTYFPLYVKRAFVQINAASEELQAYRTSVPPQAQTSFNYMCGCFDALDDLATNLRSLPVGIVPPNEIVADSVITTWSSRQAVRDRFAIREGGLRTTRMEAVSDGYSWVYEDMRLKAFYDIRIDQGQTLFQSSYF